jgi:hypothetical protein
MKTEHKYLLVTVEASTREGAIRKARGKIKERCRERKCRLVGAMPKVKHPDKKLYLWDVSYRI